MFSYVLSRVPIIRRVESRLERIANDAEIERDSAKDQAVIYTFILVTVGLLIYAAVRPYVERQSEVSRTTAWLFTTMLMFHSLSTKGVVVTRLYLPIKVNSRAMKGFSHTSCNTL